MIGHHPLKAPRRPADHRRMGGIRRFQRHGRRLFKGMTHQDITDTITSELLLMGIPMAFIHATETCDFTVTEANRAKWQPEELDEWEAALDEGEAIYGRLPEGAPRYVVIPDSYWQQFR